MRWPAICMDVYNLPDRMRDAASSGGDFRNSAG